MRVFLLRHAETAWTITGQHTGRTDLELTARGREQALELRPLFERLRAGRPLDLVYSSPRRRALETWELAAGAEPRPTVTDALAEFDYGAFEGLTPAQIQARVPGWNLWNDGCPDGESVEQVSLRVDRFIELVKSAPAEASVCAVSHGHLLRALAARMLNLSAAEGRIFGISTASVAELTSKGSGFVLSFWNRTV